MKKSSLPLILTVFSLTVLTSCGSPRSSVRVLNNADATTDVHVSVGSGGTTTVSVDPKIDSNSINLNPLK